MKADCSTGRSIEDAVELFVDRARVNISWFVAPDVRERAFSSACLDTV